MVSAMNTAISSGANGIAVAIIDAKAFNAPTENALSKGIPVVAYNADAPPNSGNKRLAYIGQDLFVSGQKMGERIVELIPSGDVAGFIATPGSLNIQPRIDGAKQAIKDSGKPINFTQVATGPQVNQELSTIDAYYQGHKSLKGMFAVDAGSTQGVAQTMQKYNLPAKGIHGGGYDLLPTTLNLINKGFLDFTIDQQPYLQGFYPTVQLFLYKISGGLMAPSDTNTGLLFVTKDNVKPYLTTKTRYEGSSSSQQYVKTT
jgi:simple sugar transport system substrate-binding protein